MQFTTLSLAFMATLAVAHPNVPKHFHPRHLGNSSVAAASSTVPLTTLTVNVTSTHTVISCAATITDCPADQSTQEVVVTDTIVVATVS